MLNKDKINIVIVTFNGISWLKKCLTSCGKYSIIVVDNASTDDTVTFIETHFPHVTLLKQDKNLGFGQANNIGISYALNQGAEHVFLLNQDAYLIGDALEQLVVYQKEQPEYGILSPIHVTSDQKRLDARFSNYLSYKYNPDFYSDYVLGNDLKKVYPIPFVNAAGWLLSKTCLLTVGGFDPLFFHYGEDDNYCQRVRFNGLRIGVVPNSYMIHDREDRAKIKPKPFEVDYLQAKLRIYQLQFGNINNPNGLVELDKKISYLKVRSVKAKLLMKPQTEGIQKEYKLLKDYRTGIIDSYQTNKREGSHYLILENE